MEDEFEEVIFGAKIQKQTSHTQEQSKNLFEGIEIQTKKKNKKKFVVGTNESQEKSSPVKIPDLVVEAV